MSRILSGLKRLVIGVVVLILIGVVALFVLVPSGDVADDETPTPDIASPDGTTADLFDVADRDWRPIAPGSTNESASLAVYQALATVGLDDASVQVTDELAYIRYEQPEVRSDLDGVGAWMYTFGAVSVHAPATERTVIRAYIDGEPTMEIAVPTADVIALLDYEITMDEFRERASVRAL